MEDRLMTVKQLGSYLNVNERTVLKLVSEGAIPGVKIGNQWRFRKAMIDTWLDDQMLGVSPRHLNQTFNEGTARKLLSFNECFGLQHIIPELSATTKIGVIEELATSAQRLGLVRDKTWFVGSLIERENVLPTALGNGIAYLHTLRRNPREIVRPFMILGRAPEGIDFDAVDGQLTMLFFVMGLKYEVLHLPWMHKLYQMLAGEEVRRELQAAPNAEAMFTILMRIESRFGDRYKK
jgi:excisionase family DNA binding protein